MIANNNNNNNNNDGGGDPGGGDDERTETLIQKLQKVETNDEFLDTLKTA